jgi:quercetin dioxygenase-like cupin family protein
VRIIHGRPDGPVSERRGDTFSGTVYADPVLPATDGVTISAVFFTPAARTFWHRHERGQVLHVLLGSGWVCAQGGQPHRIRAGDTVWVRPGETHWHGGGSTTVMSHLAISLGRTEWFDEVPEADYDTATANRVGA